MPKLTTNQKSSLIEFAKRRGTALNGLTLKEAQSFLNDKFQFHISEQTTLKLYSSAGLNFSRIRTPSKQVKQELCHIKILAIAIREIYDDIGSKQHPGITQILKDLNVICQNEG